MEQDVEPDHLSDAVLDRISVQVVRPEQADLSFARRVELYVEAPGLGPTRVGYAEDFDPGEREFTFVTDDVDISEYVAADTLTLVAVVEGQPPEYDVEIEGVANLHVGVTLAGACSQL